MKYHRTPTSRNRRALHTCHPLEHRRLFAAVTVTTNLDVLDGNTASIGNLLAAPGGVGISLREAVIAANNTPGADIITLPGGTFTLTRAGADDNCVNGDLDVTGALTITGAGSGATFIQAGTNATNGIDKIFSFNPLGLLAGFAVSLSGMTLQFGRNSQSFASGNGMGGAMDFDTGTGGAGGLNMSNVICTQNSTADGDGGAIALFGGGVVSLSGCQLTNNTVHFTGSAGTAGVTGGGLFVGNASAGSVTLSNCTISNNRVDYTIGSRQGSGGGIFSFGTLPVILHNCTISGNQAGVDGGGVAGLNLTVDQNSIISSNSAGRWGGGIYSSGGTSNVSSITITGNSAGGSGGQGGGGVFVNAGTLTVSNSRIVGNTASGGASAADRNSAGGGTMNAINNWWGTNSSPVAMVAATGISFNPWLVMSLSASSTAVLAGSSATSTLTASITKNSNGGTGVSVPNGTSVSFGGSRGSASPTSSTTTSGSATSTWTVGSAGGVGNATATLDSQTLSVNINITPQTPTAPDLQSASDAGISNTDNLTNATNLTFDASGVDAGATVELLLDGAPVASRVGPGALTATSAPVGTHAYSLRQTVDSLVSSVSASLNVSVDRTAPGVNSTAFKFDTSTPLMEITFNEDVAGSVSVADFEVLPVPSGSAIALTLNYNSPLATLFMPKTLPDNNYRFRAIAAGITDAAGNALAADKTLDFFFLRGDANRDRFVDTQDFNRLAANFGGSNKVFSQGNFNYDTLGMVDSSDFSTFVAQYGKRLAPPVAAPISSVFGGSLLADAPFWDEDVINL